MARKGKKKKPQWGEERGFHNVGIWVTPALLKAMDEEVARRAGGDAVGRASRGAVARDALEAYLTIHEDKGPTRE